MSRQQAAVRKVNEQAAVRKVYEDTVNWLDEPPRHNTQVGSFSLFMAEGVTANGDTRAAARAHTHTHTRARAHTHTPLKAACFGSRTGKSGVGALSAGHAVLGAAHAVLPPMADGGVLCSCKTSMGVGEDEEGGVTVGVAAVAVVDGGDKPRAAASWACSTPPAQHARAVGVV